MKILTRFSFHQLTKKKLNLFSPSLDINKSTGPYSFPSKVLNRLKNDISEQLADLVNLFFTTGTFPTLLKTAKVIPIHKKDSKSNFTNCHPMSLLSNLIRF